MHIIKLENFKREYPHSDFPKYRALSDEEARKTANTFAAKLNMPRVFTSLELVKELRKQSSLIPDLDADSDDFDLMSAISKLGIYSKEQVLINWYRFDQIDEISLDNLSGYFDDIWYIEADDIDIFDDTFSWILSIGYSGEVYYKIF